MIEQKIEEAEPGSEQPRELLDQPVHPFSPKRPDFRESRTFAPIRHTA
jgi:hypothetical protein